MPALKANSGICEGYANCVVAAPDAYDIDDSGVVVLLKGRITDDERPRIEEAARSCPVNALSVEDD